MYQLTKKVFSASRHDRLIGIDSDERLLEHKLITIGKVSERSAQSDGDWELVWNSSFLCDYFNTGNSYETHPSSVITLTPVTREEFQAQSKYIYYVVFNAPLGASAR